MVDVTLKQPNMREGTVPKNAVLAISRIAGIQAAQRTPELLPLAHAIGAHGCELDPRRGPNRGSAVMTRAGISGMTRASRRRTTMPKATDRFHVHSSNA